MERCAGMCKNTSKNLAKSFVGSEKGVNFALAFGNERDFPGRDGGH